MLLLGEQPKQEWIAELSRLIWAEMQLDESYRGLRWYVVQECPWSADDSPTEGYDDDGLGLLYWRMSRDPDFGGDREWRLEDIMEHREEKVNISGGHWLQENLEFLAIREWKLEVAYKQLLDSAQQQGGAPIAWDYEKISYDNCEILTDESAVENMEIAIPKAEADGVEFQRARAVGPSLQQQPEVVNILPPAESLATEQSVMGLCSSLTEEGDPVVVDGTVVSTHSNPAEELATEQSAPGLCSPLTEEGVPGVVDGTSVSTGTTPEKGTGLKQEDVGFALQAPGDFHLTPVDGTSVSTGIPHKWWPVGPDPQQHDGLSPATL